MLPLLATLYKKGCRVDEPRGMYMSYSLNSLKGAI